MSQPFRYPDQPAEEDGKNHYVTTRRREQQARHVQAGLAGRPGKFHPGVDDRTARLRLHLAQAGPMLRTALVPRAQAARGPVIRRRRSLTSHH